MDKNPASFQAPPSAHPHTSEEVALCDFLLQLRSDESSGGSRPLGEYLNRFPGLEVEIAREYLARLDRGIVPSVAPTALPRVLPRYQPGQIIGRGGMGEVRKARDLELDRDLAMKTLRRPGARARQRFLREASITGRLDHPGVVPVHELGVDETGQPFFTMKHVEGIDLDEVFERVRRNDPVWSLARALEALIKVCDTMAFAHSRGIVHRDLKPSNVRVGRFGEVYVMDWGLARVLADAPAVGNGDVEEEASGSAADSPALTLDGDVLGTPAYMAPEQAEGRNAAVSQAVDVYAVGAMLYQLLSGRRPYASDGERRSQSEVLELVRAGAPESLRVVAASMPGELVAICEKAMQRQPSQRYAEMEAFARDLRAFLERRVVAAYDTSPFERGIKWARRNLSFVVPAAVIVLGAVIGAVLVRHGRLEGRQRLLQLSRSQLVTAFDTLWPPQAANQRALERWLEHAEEVLATRAQDQVALEELKRGALPMDPDAPAERAERARLVAHVRKVQSLIRHYERMSAEIARGERAPPEGLNAEWVATQVEANRAVLERDRLRQPRHLTFRFADDQDQVLFEALTLLLSEQEKILGGGRPFGLVELARWGIAASRQVEELSFERARLDWERARRSIADRDDCPAYDGLDLSPQLGLAPIGRDPRSGLWEFAHVLSGVVPERASDGTLTIDEHSALVLVLIPGGTLLRGSQREDPTAPNFDPWSESNAPTEERPELEPFFLSKYELTQAQWKRVTGRIPNEQDASLGWSHGGLHPLQDVSFDDARRFLRVMGLALPTEAQWEWAQRAGTDTPWSSGALPESVTGHANIVGRVVLDREFAYARVADLLPDFDDGFAALAPVGSFLPNPFGLHDMMGNVREWCRDTGSFEYLYGLWLIETGERLRDDDGTRAVRGGSFAQSVLRCRSAARDQAGPLFHATDLGIRPARDIDR